MASIETRLQALERVRARAEIDLTRLTDDQLRALVSPFRRADPAGWARLDSLLDSLSDDELLAVAAGDAAMIPTQFCEAVELAF